MKLAFITVTFQLPGHWDWGERRRDRRQRVNTGYSSIRVTRATRRALIEFADRIAREHPGWMESRRRRRLSPEDRSGKIPLDELLAAIARGRVLLNAVEAVPDVVEDVNDTVAITGANQSDRTDGWLQQGASPDDRGPSA